MTSPRRARLGASAAQPAPAVGACLTWRATLLACAALLACGACRAPSEAAPARSDAVPARAAAPQAAASAPAALPRAPAPSALHPDALASPVTPFDALAPVPFERLCTTLGRPRPSAAGFSVDDPKLRATIAGSNGRAVELTLRYLGETAERAALRSGDDRTQLGLELLAANTCNLVYAMWRIEPAPELVVQVKQNPGARRHQECKNGGYRRLRPERSSPLPPLVPGSIHRIAARVDGDRLEVLADGARVWEGRLDEAARGLSGPAGLRSDNVRFDVVRLQAASASAAPAPCAPPP